MVKNDSLHKVDNLFEVSWEVCNKVGGIHTVIATKVLSITKEVKGEYLLLGPDVLREAGTSSEFIEDPNLFKAWRTKAAEDGLQVRIGRWNITGKPVAILVNFTDYFDKKNEILKMYWDEFKLDSISGQWDYLEPALFGYAAGKVIEHYTKFHFTPRHKTVAHFHEWMTGTGLLYLKKNAPQIATVFTTHATVLGRCLAGNGQALYNNMEVYNPDTKAHEFNVVSKQSLEKYSAQYADCFATVSEITARECSHFLAKDVDVVTPNGFENTIVPSGKEFAKKSSEGRAKLIEVAEAMLSRKLDNENTLLVGIGGRYEYKNKGIDIFIEALAKLKDEKDLSKNIVAFILVPAGHHGPSKELLHNLKEKGNATPLDNRYTTHYLSDASSDPSLNTMQRLGVDNSPASKVSIIFVPSYLNGNDGVLNLPYYELLMGLDISVFPSYYEPWGYTPLESLAFKVPTITTTLAGFGLWVNTYYTEDHSSIEVIERDDVNDAYVVEEVAKKILAVAKLGKNEHLQLKDNAEKVSTIALWSNLIQHYIKAYSIALSKVTEWVHNTPMPKHEEQLSFLYKQLNVEKPNWARMFVERSIPKSLEALEELAKNLWWCWNQDAIDLFSYIDESNFTKLGCNPIALLDKISYKRYQELEKDEQFVAKLQATHKKYKAYMNEKKSMTGPQVAYFSMEYGLHASLKIYSGGLGILAGDYLKEASDKGTRITAVGLLYRYGYFTQKFSAAGDQVAEYEPQDFTKIPVQPVRDDSGYWLSVNIALPGRLVTARIWRVDVGRIEMYLLDTDIEDNRPEDRSITHQLYGGDWENRLKQELLLGVGGIRALHLLGIDADVYHCNEGHAAFIGLERIRELIIENNLSFAEAMEVVSASSLFTTHTPVPAGHDAFPEDLLRKHISHYPDRFQISWDELMSLGKIHPNDPNEKFSMSYLAANLSQEVNGVSRLHGKVSQDVLKDMWPGYYPNELHVGYVTNGVHYPTWTAPEWKAIFEEEFGPEFKTHHYDKSCFDNIYNVEDGRIWEVRMRLKNILVSHIKERLSAKSSISYYTPQELVEIKENLRPEALTIAFARRFATYKRAHLLFNNLERLNKIINHPKTPVQFIFAGKAHPADKAGQDLIKKIIEISKLPQFIGKIVFLNNYDMELAKKMVQGSDVWLNTPTRPLEASGTSGEKAVLNGVLHFSVLDGWWAEGYQPEAGWSLPEERMYENQAFQDELDAETIYSLIENEIVSLYYKRSRENIPSGWIKYIKNSIAKVASNFTTNRMLIDYEEAYYNKLAKRHRDMQKNDYQQAIELADWKRKVSREWDNIEVIDIEQPDVSKEPILIGQKYTVKVTLNIGSLSHKDVGVELVLAEQNGDIVNILETNPLEYAKASGSVVEYAGEFDTDYPGVILAKLRVYPTNPKLPHRQDFSLVKWI